jgi:hypothetical protein
MSDSLIIHDSQIPEAALRIVSNLVNLGLIEIRPHIHEDRILTEDQFFQRCLSSVEKTLRFQKHVHDNWEFGQEETSSRHRMDIPVDLPRDGSAAI